MARLWSSGFELNSTTSDVEWSAGVNISSSDIQTSVVRSGDYALRMTADGTTKYLPYDFNDPESAAKVFIRFYLRIATLPSSEINIFVSNDTGNLTSSPNVFITLDQTGALALFDEDGQIGSDSSALSLDTWYRVEVLIDTTTAAGSHEVRARIDGTEFAGSSTRNIASSNNLRIMGFIMSGSTGDLYYDDVAINDATGSFQNSYPGEGSIIHLRPNAPGDKGEWTNSHQGFPSTANFQDVDEVTPDDGTSYVYNAVNGDIDDYNLTATPSAIGAGDTITLVHVGVRYAGLATSSNHTFVLRIKASSGGTVEESSGITPNSASFNTNSNSAPKNYPLTLYDLPGASTTAWTKSDLDSAQIGQRISAASAFPPKVSTVWLVVEYIPSAPVATTRSHNLGTLGAGA